MVNDFQNEVMQAVEQGMTAKFLVAKFGISFDMADQLIEMRSNLELEKQYEAMQYAEDAANFDAQYYGEML